MKILLYKGLNKPSFYSNLDEFWLTSLSSNFAIYFDKFFSEESCNYLIVRIQCKDQF